MRRTACLNPAATRHSGTPRSCHARSCVGYIQQSAVDRCLREAARREEGAVGWGAVPGHGQGHVLRGDRAGDGDGDGKAPVPLGRYW